MNPGLAGLGAALSWGTADFIARFNGRAIGSDRTLLVVLGLSTLMLTPIALMGDLTPLFEPTMMMLVAGGAVSTLAGLWLLYESLSRGPLSVVVPVLASYPLPLVLWAVAFQGLSITGPLIAAMALTLAGVWVVARAGSRTQHKEGHAIGRLSVTIALAAGTIVTMDSYVVIMDEAIAQLGILTALWATRLLAFVVMAILTLARRRTVPVSGKLWALLAVQGMLDVLGFALLFIAEGDGGTALATIASSAYGVVTVAMARMFLKEIVTPAGWLGIALVFAGVVTLTATG